MTKEQVAEIIRHCSENKISYKQRLSELGVSPWSFYHAKKTYRDEEEGMAEGEFVQLFAGSAFESCPLAKLDSSVTGRRRTSSCPASGQVTVELRPSLRA